MNGALRPSREIGRREGTDVVLLAASNDSIDYFQYHPEEVLYQNESRRIWISKRLSREAAS